LRSTPWELFGTSLDVMSRRLRPFDQVFDVVVPLTGRPLPLAASR
jgi:hypothetical protein